MALGADISWADFWMKNMLPVTLGNTIGGFVFMGVAYSLSYGALGKKANA